MTNPAIEPPSDLGTGSSPRSMSTPKKTVITDIATATSTTGTRIRQPATPGIRPCVRFVFASTALRSRSFIPTEP